MAAVEGMQDIPSFYFPTDYFRQSEFLSFLLLTCVFLSPFGLRF